MRRVQVAPLAARDLEDYYLYAAARAPSTAASWLARFDAAIQGLSISADRCGKARESRRLGIDLRESLFGKRPNVYRVVFLLDDEAVTVLRILRASRRWLTPKDLG